MKNNIVKILINTTSEKNNIEINTTLENEYFKAAETYLSTELEKYRNLTFVAVQEPIKIIEDDHESIKLTNIMTTYNHHHAIFKIIKNLELKNNKKTKLIGARHLK